MSMESAEEAGRGSSQHQNENQKGRRQKFLSSVKGKALRAKLSGKVNRSLSTSEIRKLKEAYHNARSIKKYKKLKQKLVPEGNQVRFNVPKGDENGKDPSTEEPGLERTSLEERPRKRKKGIQGSNGQGEDKSISTEPSDGSQSKKMSGLDLSESLIKVHKSTESVEAAHELQDFGGQKKQKLAGQKFTVEKKHIDFVGKGNKGQPSDHLDLVDSGRSNKSPSLRDGKKPLLQKQQFNTSERKQTAGESLDEGKASRKRKRPVSQMEKLRQDAEAERAAIKEVREAKEAEIEQRKKAREEAERKRKAISAKFRKVTSRGQPVMKHRMERLLESLQKEVAGS